MKNIGDYESIHSINPLIIGKADGYVEEKKENKYLDLASIDKSEEILKKYTEIWEEIKSLIERVNNKPGEPGKDFMKIIFYSDDNLPLNRILKLHYQF